MQLGHSAFFAIGGYFAGVLAVYVGVSAFLTAPIAGIVAMYGPDLRGIERSVSPCGPTMSAGTFDGPCSFHVEASMTHGAGHWRKSS